MSKDLFDLDFIFVVGKGGVGKTTVSAALALAAARRGQRVLVTLCNAKERLSDLLEVEPIGDQNQPVLDRIEAVNMNPDRALEEYGMMILKVRALYRAVFENKFVKSFLRGTPGIDAWSMLGKAYYHANEKTDHGRKRYDLVILDAPATGHGLDMLRVPKVIVDVAPPGLLRREAEGALDLFQDPSRTGVVMVTLPEDMPVNETVELHSALRDELQLPVNGLVVNRVSPRLFEPGERATFEELEGRVDRNSALFPLVRAARWRSIRERIEQEAIERLQQELPLAQTELPRLFVEEFGRAEIESLSQAFD